MKNQTIVNINDSDWDIRVNPCDETSPTKLLFQAEIEEFQIREEKYKSKTCLQCIKDFTTIIIVIGLFALIIWDFLGIWDNI